MALQIFFYKFDESQNDGKTQRSEDLSKSINCDSDLSLSLLLSEFS